MEISANGSVWECRNVLENGFFSKASDRGTGFFHFRWSDERYLSAC